MRREHKTGKIWNRFWRPTGIKFVSIASLVSLVAFMLQSYENSLEPRINAHFLDLVHSFWRRQGCIPIVQQSKDVKKALEKKSVIIYNSHLFIYFIKKSFVSDLFRAR